MVQYFLPWLKEKVIERLVFSIAIDPTWVLIAHFYFNDWIPSCWSKDSMQVFQYTVYFLQWLTSTCNQINNHHIEYCIQKKLFINKVLRGLFGVELWRKEICCLQGIIKEALEFHALNGYLVFVFGKHYDEYLKKQLATGKRWYRNGGGDGLCLIPKGQ